ncbi:intraflagellar transport protein 70A-like [Corticium candelabrum]|uniref:intraflagellar transport protein 70A-like n=1 Tax=Corticium candelabrum TaxID=121492 RepID=UPI002E3757E8|nr:intraflagellar transport protein 70A-like [Corticium candelabrum]
MRKFLCITMAARRIVDGQYTQTVYSLIKGQKYGESIEILSFELQKHPKSRAALSLLGYCYFHMQDFLSAADCYEQLTLLHPEVDEYKLYHAQALYKACRYPEAMKVTFQIENLAMQQKVVKLQAAIKFGEEDVSAARAFVEQFSPDDSDSDINVGCLLYKEGQYEEAAVKFTTAMRVLGYNPHLCYSIALSYYQMKQYAVSLKHIADIIERGIRDYPELSVGVTTEGIDVRSVGNTALLQETALVEAFNLKAAIEYQLKNFEAAREALTDMPPRSEEELDSVTLHNHALMHMEEQPTQGFEKFQFLLQQNPCPPETFGNVLLLYCKYQYYDLAADVLAENAHLTYKYLTPFMFDYLDAVITQQSSPDDAFRKFDTMAASQTEQLRKLTKQVQSARQRHDEDDIKRAINDYEEALERYIPVLMAQAKIYWDQENYPIVEKIFRKSVEFCNEHDVWKLNVAHVLFMQETKYKEAIGFYEPIVKKHREDLLTVSAIVLANLCVSYIMTSQNEAAEDLMRRIEKEEENIAYEDPDRKIYHLCIVNLVIGTLYCAKGNYEFGISRIMKSLEPYHKKLGTDTWFYTKRCFCSLIENMAKQMIMLRDSVVQEILQFFDHCEAHGRNVPVVIEQPLQHGDSLHEGKNTVTYDARLLKALFLRVL